MKELSLIALIALVVFINVGNLAYVIVGLINGPSRSTVFNAFSLGVVTMFAWTKFRAWRHR